MGRRGRQKSPVTVHLDRLEEKHTSGLDEQNRRWKIRGAPVGATVTARPGRKQTARRLSLDQAPLEQVDPSCPVFGICGGCQLQEMQLTAQRFHKAQFVQRTILGEAIESSVQIHPVRGDSLGYGYRNKLELSFGTRQFLAEAPTGPPPSEDQSYLGFHPPGWYSKIVDMEGCPLGTKAMNQAIAAVREHMPGPAWSSTQHTGHWRHLVLRDTGHPKRPRLHVSLVTTSEVDRTELNAVANRIASVPGITGVSGSSMTASQRSLQVN